jgi:Tol biopolymer transport system component
MKILFIASVLLLLVGTISSAQQTTADFPKLTGPYLGQTPPGNKAELFAPGVVSTGNFEHSSPVFTPDRTEIYWSTIIEENGTTVSRPTYYMKLANGVWSKPEIPSFGKSYPTCEYPFVSPDGKRLFFSVGRTAKAEKLDLYYVNRVGDGWSDPISLGEAINTASQNESQPTVAKNGTIFFVGPCEKARTGFGLYYSIPANGKYQAPVFMEEKFNSLQVDWTPYVAPDESYFIFSSAREGGLGSCDLYICFKQKDGSWGKIVSMGDRVNSDANDRFPNVTPDGKYLFFNSTRKIPGADPNGPGNGDGNIYWIDAKIIDELRSQGN